MSGKRGALACVPATVTEPSMTLAQAQAVLRVSPGVFRRLVQQGHITCLYARGNRSLYREANVLAVAEQRQRWAEVAQDYYPYTQARARLGVTLARFFRVVERYQVRRLEQDGKCFGYHKADIDALAAQGFVAQRLAEVTDAYYTATQAAERLSVSTHTIPALVTSGKLHPVPVAGYVHPAYDKAEVEALAAEPKRLQDQPDAEAFAELYEAFYNDGVGYLVHGGLSHEDAEDLVQQEFADLWNYGASLFAEIPTLERRCKVMYPRLRMRLMGWYRERRLHADLERQLVTKRVDWCRPTVPGIEQQVIDREEIRRIMDISRRRFPQAYHQIVQLVAMGYTSAEISAYLQEQGVAWQLETVAHYRADALAKLRVWLGVQDGAIRE